MCFSVFGFFFCIYYQRIYTHTKIYIYVYIHIYVFLIIMTGPFESLLLRWCSVKPIVLFTHRRRWCFHMGQVAFIHFHCIWWGSCGCLLWMSVAPMRRLAPPAGPYSTPLPPNPPPTPPPRFPLEVFMWLHCTNTKPRLCWRGEENKEILTSWTHRYDRK